jgi:hypothetical protein
MTIKHASVIKKVFFPSLNCLKAVKNISRRRNECDDHHHLTDDQENLHNFFQQCALEAVCLFYASHSCLLDIFVFLMIGNRLVDETTQTVEMGSDNDKKHLKNLYYYLNV